MNTLDAIYKRYSCRAFDGSLPSEEALQAIARAAVAAPSAMNRQPWQVIVVKDTALMAELETAGLQAVAALPNKALYERIQSRGGKLFYNAPCMVVLAVNTTEPNGYELLDCGIATQNMALAATALGVDSLICGLARLAFALPQGEDFKRRLGFADGYEFAIAVLLGHAAQTGGTPHELDATKISVV